MIYIRIKEILLHVYQNPDIRHKDLSDKLGIKPTYLNELIKLLEPTGSVNKYAYGRCTYYELTLEGQRYVEEYLKDSGKDDDWTFLNKNEGLLPFEHKKYLLDPNGEKKPGYVKETVRPDKKIFYFIDYDKKDNAVKLWG